MSELLLAGIKCFLYFLNILRTKDPALAFLEVFHFSRNKKKGKQELKFP